MFNSVLKLNLLLRDISLAACFARSTSSICSSLGCACTRLCQCMSNDMLRLNLLLRGLELGCLLCTLHILDLPLLGLRMHVT